MPLFFRAIESEDGSWGCRQGRTELDRHQLLIDALEHLRELAQASAPAQVIAHWRDGRVERLEEIDE